MNKLKFRAWDTRNNRMITEFGDSNRVETKDGSNYVDLQARKDGTVKAVLMEFKNSGIFTRPVEDLLTMQYTGLKDKNGVEIYEGDILLINDDGYGTTISEVTWGGEEYPAFDIPKYDGDTMNGFAAIHFSDLDITMEVIGNIHENPELLKN